MSEVKYREFFMSDSCITTETHQEFRVAATFPNGTVTGEYIHVIEYSAIAAKDVEIQLLKAELSEAKKQIYELQIESRPLKYTK